MRVGAAHTTAAGTQSLVTLKHNASLVRISTTKEKKTKINTSQLTAFECYGD